MCVQQGVYSKGVGVCTAHTDGMVYINKQSSVQNVSLCMHGAFI